VENGLVYKSTGSSYRVKINGEMKDCVLTQKHRLLKKRTTNPIAVGDHVLVNMESVPYVIEELKDRKNYIIRKSVNLSKESHVIASNMDVVLIVASVAKPRTSTGFIDRILVTAEAYGIPAAIVFNKSDAMNEKETALTQEYSEEYDFLGYKTFVTSALKKEGIDVLKDFLTDKTVLVIGHSGVGKSSLLNAVAPELNIKTGDISKKHEKGMHTTTFAEMHDTDFGTKIIDTPGVKEFGLVEIDARDLSGYFPEIRTLSKNCKFYNCLHKEEPGCAVVKALETGEIALFRYENYLNMLEASSGKNERL
jgi:ribosome biogenesis GTPase / thiamine phosphate phosphatase